MANTKAAYSLNQGVTKDTLLNGILIGSSTYGVVQAIKKIQENRRMRKQLAKLEELTQNELAKDDISLSGDFFIDRYSPQMKKKAEGLRGLPGLAWLLTGIGAGYAGTGIIHELLTKKRPAQTPSFAVEYKKRRKEEFDRAARLLRAVTDAPTWKDVATEEKTAGMKKQANDIAKFFRDLLGLDQVGKDIGREAGGALGSISDTFTNYVQPAIAATVIGGAGYLGYKGLNKLLYAIRKYKNKSVNDAYAANAWLAQRKDLGEAGKVLNTYVESDDSLEREELNKLLAAYEDRYKK